MYIPSLVISGMQTGADLGGLYGADAVGISTGGFAPKGYRTELGPRPDLGMRFGLIESESSDFNVRTDQNLRITDVAIVVARNFESPGTYLTKMLIWKYKIPMFEVPFPTLPSLESDTVIGDIQKWLQHHKPCVLAVAGNRESKAHGIQKWTEEFLIKLFT